MNTTKYLLTTLALAGAVFLPGRSMADVTLYSQDFETATPGITGPVLFGGFGQINNVGGASSGWQAQGGGGTDGTHPGLSVTVGIDNGGVGFSQGLFSSWDHSTSTGYTFDQLTVYGAVNAPGLGVGLNGIKIEMDIYISGSSGAFPLGVSFQQYNVAQNITTEWDYSPMLTDGDWTHVSFTADMGTQSGPNPFDNTLASTLRIQFGPFGGFDFDSGNIVELDNIVVSNVPEPSSMALVGLGSAALMLFRRRRA